MYLEAGLTCVIGDKSSDRTTLLLTHNFETSEASPLPEMGELTTMSYPLECLKPAIVVL